MTFEEWWEQAGDGRSKMMAKRAWKAATALEREVCAKACQEQSIRFAEAMNGKAAYGAVECERAIMERSNEQGNGPAR